MDQKQDKYILRWKCFFDRFGMKKRLSELKISKHGR